MCIKTHTVHDSESQGQEEAGQSELFTTCSSTTVKFASALN